MTRVKPKHKIKDSVFTNLFQDKNYLLQLYQTLHPEDTNVTTDDIRDVTMKHVLVNADYNDLGFSVQDRLIILVESQSTFSMNIIIRALMYLIQTYHDYFKRTKQNLYGSKKVTFPKPELYMIYVGEQTPVPDILSLADEFFEGEDIAIEAKVKVLYQENENDIIGQYIIFCKVYNEQRRKYGNTLQAVTETIRICQNRNILKEYLQEKQEEVIDIMMTLFDDEQILDAYTKELVEEAEKKGEKRGELRGEKRGELRGEKRGEQKSARNTAIQMIKKGKLSLEEISEYIPSLSMNDLKQLEAEVFHLT